jgi:hypothetical protein
MRQGVVNSAAAARVMVHDQDIRRSAGKPRTITEAGA